MAQVIGHTAKSQPGTKGQAKEQGIADSSFLMSISYGDKTLKVTMKKGDVYEYTNVPSDIAEQFMISNNKGGFYSNYIKGKFTSQRTVDRTVGPPISKKK